MIDRVVGITIWTDNLKRLLIFYRDTLGLNPRSEHADFINFQFGEMRLNIGLHNRVIGSNSEPYRIMINLGVDDINIEHTRLMSMGVEFIRTPEQETWGGWVATFLDPDGNVLQLLQGAS